MQSNELFKWWQLRAREREQERQKNEAAARKKAAEDGSEYEEESPPTNGLLETLPAEIRLQIYSRLGPRERLRLAGTSWVMAIELHVEEDWQRLIVNKKGQRMQLYVCLNLIQQALLGYKILNPRLCCICVQLHPSALAMHDKGYYQTDQVIKQRNWTARICFSCDPSRCNDEIYQTEAQRVFKVSASVLRHAKIPFKLQPNPGGYTYRKTKVFKMVDVYEVVWQKAMEKGERKEIKQAQQLKRKREQAEEQNRNKRVKLEQNKRQKQLKDALKPHGLQILKDSTLCDQYISGKWDKHHPDFKGKGTLEEVVDSVLRQHYLDEHTSYREMLKLTKVNLPENGDDVEETFDTDLQNYRIEMQELALQRLEDVEKAYANDKMVKTCKCGKKQLKQYLEVTL